MLQPHRWIRSLGPAITIAVLSVCAWALTLDAQEEPPTVVALSTEVASVDLPVVQDGSRKSPALAFLLGFLITGGGQVYNGQYVKAAIMFGGAAVGIGVALAYFEDCWDFDEDCGPVYGGLGVAFGMAIWSMIDAPLSASKINRELAAGGALRLGPQLRSGLAVRAGPRYELGAEATPFRDTRVGVSLASLRF